MPMNHHLIDDKLVEEMEQKLEREFYCISHSELHEALQKTSNFSASEPDNVS